VRAKRKGRVVGTSTPVQQGDVRPHGLYVLDGHTVIRAERREGEEKRDEEEDKRRQAVLNDKKKEMKNYVVMFSIFGKPWKISNNV